MSDHARLSASAAGRWMKCAGSIAMIESLPKKDRNKTTKFSQEGTAAHGLAALALETGDSCAMAAAGTGNQAWSLEMAKEVQPYVDLVRDMSQNHTLLIERKVCYSNSIGVHDSFGTADAIIVTADNTEICIVDLKFGKGVTVEAEENEQLMLYALGAIETYDMVIDKSALKRIRLVISQPRINAVSEWDCSMEYLEMFRQDAARAAEKVIAIDSRVLVRDDFNPGEDQCRWCAASAVCPALAEKVEETLDAEFENLDISPAVPVSNELLAAKMNAIPMIESWCTAVRAAVESQLLQGNGVPGYKLVEGKRGNRKWIDEKLAENTLESWGIKKDEMYSRNLLSPSAIEKFMKDYPALLTKFNEANLVMRSEGRPSVAPENDKRPALEVIPSSEDFEDLTLTKE